MERASRLATGARVDRFVIEATIGVGGMGTVHRVRHRDLDTIHALKVPHEDGFARAEQLRHEARVQARVQHPNVVAAKDLLEVDGAIGLLMEHVHGPTLETLIRTIRLPRFEMELLVPGLLAGVGALHAAGVVHRDLKPGNVLLATQGRRVVPKLADFGMAEWLSEGQNRQGARDFGTPNYMAPEQLRNPTLVDPRIDVYALGAILYELVTGTRAFPSEDPRVVIEAASRGHIVPVRTLAPDLPERRARAIESALAVEPDARLSSCADLWRAWIGPEGAALDHAARGTLGWRGVWLGELERASPPRVSSAPIEPALRPFLGSSSTLRQPAVSPVRSGWSVTLMMMAALAGIGLIGAGASVAAWLIDEEPPLPWSPVDPIGPETSHLTPIGGSEAR